MAEIQWGVRNDYSQHEIEQLRGHEGDSTSALMNDARKAVGKTGDVVIRGDDKSAKDVREDDAGELLKEYQGPLKESGAHGALTALVATADYVAEGGPAVELGKALYDSLKSNLHAIAMGDELGKAVERDNLHRALLSQLNLPQAFKEKEMAPFIERETEGGRSVATLVSEKLKLDPAWHAKVALLQLHCDQGTTAACDMLATGQNPMAFGKAHPDVAKRYTEDPAFKAGFDAALWARGQGKETYDAVCKDLAARDARYEQAHIAVRG